MKAKGMPLYSKLLLILLAVILPICVVSHPVRAQEKGVPPAAAPVCGRHGDV